jgi:hypothetical protein
MIESAAIALFLIADFLLRAIGKLRHEAAKKLPA